MRTEPSIEVKRQRSTSRKTQQALSELQGLQKEVQDLKRQLARLEEAAHSQQQANCIPQSLPELKPRRQPAPGKTAMQMIRAQWPGEETTEQLLAQWTALKH